MNTCSESTCSALRARVSRLILPVVLALACLGAPTLRAQSNTEGYIYGAGVTAGSTILAQSVQTGMKREAAPDATGAFRLIGLPTGNYNVTLRTPGKPDEIVDNVLVSLGSGAQVRFGGKEIVALEKYVVASGSISPIDLSSVESVTVFNQEVIRQLPVARNTTAVALLAPGTTQGVNAFGNLASFGGSSVGENAYYVNGFDLTNFRNGLGGGTVPFEAYDQFQIKTGGYGAEFGRSTGGVINATTKRGGNEFKAGLNVIYSPDRLRSNSPNVFLPSGAPYSDRSQGYSDSVSANLSLSGAIVKNRLFYYGLVEGRESHTRASAITTFNRSHSKDPFYMGKLDWNITDNHTIEFTAISDKRKTDSENFAYTYATKLIGASNGVTEQHRGGKDYIFRYTGKITPDFSISALYGKSDANFTDAGAGDARPYILDARTGSVLQLGTASQAQPTTLSDNRKQSRLDGEYAFNFVIPHRLRAGLDNEELASKSVVQYSGGVYWRYVATAPARVLANGAIVPAGVTQYARRRFYQNGGAFSTNENAYYAEDNVKLIENRLLLSVGVRNETFENKNVNGSTFVTLKNQWAPRIGVSFDPTKDGQSKIFANFGRYHLPVATNTNIRLAGAETYYEEYFVLNSINADGTPNNGAQMGGKNVFSDGSIKPPSQIVDKNLKPMYQDEYILGYQRALNKHWTVGIRGIYRNVGSFLEDMAIDETLNTYAKANNIKGFAAGGNDYYVLSNPGASTTFDVDFGDGKGLRTVTFSPAELKFPKAKRQYAAVEVFFEKLYDGKWLMQGSYTNSYSWGNDEGSVLSDNGQTDAGLTILFDHPGLMDHSIGYLANDKRHKFKAFGAYNLTSEFQVGANVRIESGTPLNAFGFHPTDAFAAQYSAASFFNAGKPVPRGTFGRNPWTTQLDLSLKYKPEWGRKKVSIGIDAFNLLNSHKNTETNQTAETGLNVANPSFGLPTIFQPARSARISMSYEY